MKKQHDFATRAIHAGQSPDPSTGAIMTPIYQTSTYVQESPGRHKGYDYSRSINPTRLAYERCIADLESGTRGWAFASGLAAMATALDTLESGSHVLVSDDLYGGTFRLFERVRRRSANLDFTFIDMSDANVVEREMKPNTRMVWVETPSNPLLKLIDLEAVAKIARSTQRHQRFGQHFRQPVGAAADRVWLRHGHSFRDQISQRPLRHGRRRRRGRREQGARRTRCSFCRTRSARSPGHSTAFSPCAG